MKCPYCKQPLGGRTVWSVIGVVHAHCYNDVKRRKWKPRR
jgi:hypothetical protein